MNNKTNGSARKPDLDRRRFIGAVAAGAAGSIAAASLPAQAEDKAAPADAAAPRPVATPPSAAQAASETLPPQDPPGVAPIARSGSDYMVDVLHSLKLDYIATLPGSTFRGLHESLINYGHNKAPELLTCLHEEITVGLAHGYAKVAGKPMAALVHGVVGLQHASMAIYNVWADRVPALVLVGNTTAADQRRSGVEWAHSAQDNAAMVRDYVKWDDQPASLTQFGESTVRAYGIATTPPYGPTLIVAESDLQERAIPDKPGSIPPLDHATAPVGDPAAVAEAARILAVASNPVIVVDRLVSTRQGMDDLVSLAEALQAPVIDRNGRLNMPSRHYLNQSRSARALLARADAVIGLEVWDLFSTVNSYRERNGLETQPVLRPGAKLISITAAELLMRSNMQDFQRYQPVDLAITGDGQATLPMLLDAVRRALPTGNNAARRGDALRRAFASTHRRTLENASYGWDAVPISVARMVATLGKTIEHENWALVSASAFQDNWPLMLWNFDQPNQHIGDSGGYGVGYTGPSSVGAALAHRDAGRLAVSIMGDGELMCCPGALWTAAHHRIPLLMVMHNNRAYHQELMHIQRMADLHGRGITNARIGTAITDPDIDFAKLADSMGVWSKGPITDPADMAPVFEQALAIVKQGQPALVDVVCQGR